MKYTIELLQKCNGLRFKAKLDLKNWTEGIIRVRGSRIFLCYGEISMHNLDYFCKDVISEVDHFFLMQFPKMKFEIIPRDPETYDDWQIGDTLIDTVFDSMYKVIFRAGEVVIIKTAGDTALTFTCKKLYDMGKKLVLTEVEKQILKESDDEFHEGDVVCASAGDQHFIFVYEDWSYSLNNLRGKWEMNHNVKWQYKHIRFADAEERQLFYDALASEGKYYDLREKKIKDNPFSLKPGTPVLVRSCAHAKWKLRSFIEKNKHGNFKVTDGENDEFYSYAIPYNDKTRSYLGTDKEFVYETD